MPKEWTLDRFLERQANLRHIYCQSVILKTARLPCPILFRADWQQSADVLFYSEWATYCDRIVEIPDPLCLYRVHAQSATSANILKLEAWVLEEWNAMQFVSGLIHVSSFRKWLGAHRRRIFFAGRSKDKMRVIQADHPAYARQIRAVAIEKAGWTHWILANLAIGLRDTWAFFRNHLFRPDVGS
jgi:hypothetical protein